ILITHDLGLAAVYCDRVVVMEKGHVVETAQAAKIFKAPAHPYTRKLMRATPRLGVSLRELLPEDAPTTAPHPARVSDARDPPIKSGAGSLPGSGERVTPPEPLLVVEKLV